MIYTHNAKEYLQYPVVKSYFLLSDEDVYDMIEYEFTQLKKRLEIKNVSYDKLKRALIPNQDVGKFEICIVADSTLIDNSWYGLTIFEKLIPLLDKKSAG